MPKRRFTDHASIATIAARCVWFAAMIFITLVTLWGTVDVLFSVGR